MQQKKLIRIYTVCFLALIMLVIPLSGCASKEPVLEISWDNMHGAWVSANGEASNEYVLSIHGSIPAEFDNFETKECELNMIWPDNFEFPNDGLKTYYVSANPNENTADASPSFVYGTIFNYIPELKTHTPIDFVLLPDDGAAVFEDSENDRYFVASTNPNADLNALLDLCKEQDSSPIE